ncbi:MAG: HlyC/CorC family transporter [Candidatus Omnitrophica bacterium]|nr:HlyC/CorC family transporter [Candidatus Omnitrophota bacterium]
MSVLLGVFIILLCLAIEGFFAGSEIGIISCNRIRMSHLMDKKDKRARIVTSFFENPEEFLSTTLVGVNLAVIIASSVATAIVSKYTSVPGRDALIATVIIFPLVLIFGEIMPKIIYQQHSDTLSLLSAYPLKIAAAVLFPFVFLATMLSNAVSRIFVRGGEKKNPYVSREEIRLLMLEAAKQGVMEKHEIAMASEIFDFGRTSVQSVMVPLRNVTMAPDRSSVKDVINLLAEKGYSRLPIYSGKKDNIIGVIEMSDLAKENIEGADLRDLILPPYRVNPEKSIEDVLEDFRHNEENMAVVVDKKGMAIGIATIEDIVEEIVGEIEDEYDIAT